MPVTLPVRYHQRAREVGHGQVPGLALERRHHIELRQGRAKREAQALTQFGFHGARCFQQPQPKAQLLSANRLGPQRELWGGTGPSLGLSSLSSRDGCLPDGVSAAEAIHHTRSPVPSERVARRCNCSRPER